MDYMECIKPTAPVHQPALSDLTVSMQSFEVFVSAVVGFHSHDFRVNSSEIALYGQLQGYRNYQ